MASAPRAKQDTPERSRSGPNPGEARDRPVDRPRRMPTIVYLNLDLVAFWLVN